MKKVIAFILALSITGAVLPDVRKGYNTKIVAYAEDDFTFETDQYMHTGYMKDKDGETVLTFSLFTDHAEVYWCGRYSHVDIPSDFMGLPVTKIRDAAFQGSGSYVESVTIPDTVTSIGNGVFLFNDKLTSIVIPDSVTEIGEYAFSQNKNLKSIKLSNSLETIGYRAFYQCESLKSIELPSSLKTIGCRAFESSGLESVSFSESQETIGEYAFAWCPNLQSLTLPDKLTNIENYAFIGCKSLTSVKIPSSVERLGRGAFYKCDSLQNVSFVKKVTFEKDNINEDPCHIKSIEAFTFAECKNLESINIPSKVQEIGEDAFQNCSSLKMVILPPSVSKIGESAFENCTDLISVVIMNKDCVIGEDKEDYNNARTICNKYDYTDKIASFEGTIFGFDRPASNEYDDDMGHYSTAEIFADTYHYDFDSINFTPEVDEWGITNSSEYFGDKYFENVETPEDLDNVFIGLDEPSYNYDNYYNCFNSAYNCSYSWRCQ